MEEWALRPEPLLSLGLDESVPEALFTAIPDAVLLSDGGIAVLEPTSAELRAFRPDGTVLWVAGGKGNGPAEFSSVTYLSRVEPGVLAAPDRLGGAMNYYSETGEHLRTTPLDGGTGSGGMVSRMGSYHPPLVSGLVPLPTLDTDSTSSEGSFRTSVRLLRVRIVADDSIYQVKELPGHAGFWLEDGQTTFVGSLPLGPAWLVDTGPSFVAAGNGRSPISLLNGVTERLIPPPFAARAVDNDVQQSLRSSAGADLEVVATVLDRMEIPDSTPNYDRVSVDSMSRIWVRQFHLAGPAIWAVIDSGGAVIATVRLPADADVLDADHQTLLVRRISDQDVEYLELWHLPEE